MGDQKDLLGSHWVLKVASLWQEEGGSPLILAEVAVEGLEDNLLGMEAGKEEVHADILSDQEVVVDHVESLSFQMEGQVDSLLEEVVEGLHVLEGKAVQ